MRVSRRPEKRQRKVSDVSDVREIMADARGFGVNRKQRRAGRIVTRDGIVLEPILVVVTGADEYGRPATLRIAYEGQTVSEFLDAAGMPEAKTSDDPEK